MKKFINACFVHYRKWKKRKEADKSSILNWLWEFSKKIVVVLSIYYFLQSIYVAFLVKVVPDSVVLGTLITEINETFRVCIGGYLLKAGLENTVKICTAVYGKKHEISINNEGSDY